MSQNETNSQPAHSRPWPFGARALLAFFLPVLGAAIVGVFIGSFLADATGRQYALAPVMAATGLISWFLGLRWYGLAGLGLRGRRPFFAGIGFAVLGWVAFLLFRFAFVLIRGFGPAGSGQAFVYLLLFEALAVQLWTFGLLFRSLADWRGPMTAAIGSGIIFGTAAALLFQESFISSPSSYLYFILWGVLYGIIRLRTGSLLGTAVVQALHSFTAWVVMAPQPELAAGQLQSLYLAAGVAYLVIIWRLWPKREKDYRV
ncbi:MAG: type II CAAX prenyl endopeptidase Rce1 family protein [Anaerolineae bacterium]